jgi:hypothetical protein
MIHLQGLEAMTSRGKYSAEMTPYRMVCTIVLYVYIEYVYVYTLLLILSRLFI